MKRFIKKSGLVLLLAGLNMVAAAPVFAQAASVADVAMMQGPNRQQALIDGANSRPAGIATPISQIDESRLLLTASTPDHEGNFV